VPGVTGQADFLARIDPFTDFDKCAVLLQMVVLAGRPVIVHHNDEIGIFPTAVLPASFVVRLFDASNNTFPRGMNRRADVHPEIHSVLLDTPMAKP
jgi:hypothetical protein